MVKLKRTMSQSQRVNPTEEEDDSLPFNAVIFQSDLDASLSLNEALIQSWLPKDYTTTSSHGINGFNGFNGFNGIKADRGRDRGGVLDGMNRPPRRHVLRLGLGASLTSYHQQQAEEMKLRQRMLKSTRSQRLLQEQEDEQDVVSSVRKLNGSSLDTNVDGSHDDEEEESRSRSIKKRELLVNPQIIGSSTSLIGTKKKNKIRSSNASSLDGGLETFKQPVASGSFYSSPSTLIGKNASSNPVDRFEVGGKKLTKNQRKKEREKEKKPISKSIALESSLLEHDSPTSKGKKRRLETDEPIEAEEEEDADDSDATSSTTALQQRSSSNTNIPQQHQQGLGQQQKKKRRKKKGKVTIALEKAQRENEGQEGLLNLGR